MGVYTREDSPFYWLYLPRRGQAGLREPTDVLVMAPKVRQRNANRALAEERFHVRMAQLASGSVTPPTLPDITFRAFAAWFAQHVLPTRRGHEREAEILPRLVAFFGDLFLREITRVKANEYQTWRRERGTAITRTRRVHARTVTPGPNTINREIDLLKAVLQAAVPTYLTASPLFGMKRLRTATPKRRLMTEDEERRLLKVLAPDDRALFLLAEDSLVRLSDVLDVQWRDDHGQTMWIADPKAGGGFAVPISKRTRRALDALKISSDISGYIFPRRRRAATERDRRNGVRQMLERACADADPPIPFGRVNEGLTFHWSTRRTGATRMLTRGTDPGTVQKVGRWKTANVVLGIYHELLDEKAHAAVESVGRRRRVRNT